MNFLEDEIDDRQEGRCYCVSSSVAKGGHEGTAPPFVTLSAFENLEKRIMMVIMADLQYRRRKFRQGQSRWCGRPSS